MKKRPFSLPPSPSSYNGTYQDDTDREAIQLEVDALKSEIDRISSATEYNGMKLLDGSLGGSSVNSGNYGPKFGYEEAGFGIVTANVAGIKVNVTVGASGNEKGSEFATWKADGKELEIGLVAGKTYTQSEIDELVKGANQAKAATNSPCQVNIKLDNGIFKATAIAAAAGTAAGVRATTGDISFAAKGLFAGGVTATGIVNYADKISFTRNSYGDNTAVGNDGVTEIAVNTKATAGKETVTVDGGGKMVVDLATGVEYTDKDIESILKKNGYDYEVKLTATVAPNGDANNVVKFTKSDAAVMASTALAGGKGVAKGATGAAGEGLTFQIGANGVEDQRVTLNVDDMSSAAIGVANADVSTRDAANEAINMVDAAVKTVSMQRAGLGALQNRLEYTVNNLTTTNENLTNAESQIRDTDMATEMINYTKFNILQQASQAMLAQANQQPQAVLQLLG